MINKESIKKAYKMVRPYIRRTPLMYSKVLSDITGASVFFKMESLQHTGSFKPRGAFNCLLNLDLTCYKGIIAPTAGNHGIALAYAGNQLNIPVHIYVPKGTDPSIIENLRSFNSKTELFKDYETAHHTSLKMAKNRNYKFLSAYNNGCMINGAGTIGIEISEDIKDVDIVLIPVGGGGLIAGISTFLKSINPEIEIWGVQTKNSPTISRWFHGKKVVDVEIKESIATGLSGMVECDVITFPVIKERVDRFIELSEDELAEGMRYMMENHGVMLEPSGVAAVSALIKTGSDLAGKKIISVVTGKNISSDRFNKIIKNGTQFRQECHTKRRYI